MRLTNNKRARVPADWSANGVPTYLRGMAAREALACLGRCVHNMFWFIHGTRTGPCRRACLLSLLVPGGRAPYVAVWVPGIDESGTAGAEQSFHLLDCFVDNAARPPGLELPLQFNEGLIGAVETPCQDRRNVK